MKDYRRLKTDENSRLSLNWNLNREISKLNYRIHTDAIKDNLIPPELTPAQVAKAETEWFKELEDFLKEANQELKEYDESMVRK